MEGSRKFTRSGVNSVVQGDYDVTGVSVKQTEVWGATDRTQLRHHRTVSCGC